VGAFACAALALAGQPALARPAPASNVTLQMVPTGGSAVAQGLAFGFQATLTNPDPAPANADVVFELAAPSPGGTVDFMHWRVAVPGSGSSSKSWSVIPAQWFAQTGGFQVVALQTGQQFGSPLPFTVTAPTVPVPAFSDVTAQAGLLASIPAGVCSEYAVGAAWGDVNGDGALDLFQPVPGGPSHLWVNDGTGHFTDEAAVRGVVGDGRLSVGATFADYDDDGDPDLYVVNDGPNQLYRNDGGGQFTDVTLTAGVGDAGVGPSASWGDFNGDGWVDLYVANHAACGVPQPDRLYENNGNGTFTDVTAWLGTNATVGAGFEAGWFDADGDGDQDLYLANDKLGLDANHLFRNDGAGLLGTWTFTDVSAASKTNYLMSSMGLAIGDYNRDLHLDFAVSNIGGNVLAKNAGNGTFTSVGSAAGVARVYDTADVRAVTWGLGFADLNLDGWEDLYVAAGGLDDTGQGNAVYVSSNGTKFLDLSAPSGANDGGSGRGVAFADYDRDGRMDVYVVNVSGQPRLYRNVTALGGRHWLEVDTVGTVSNRDGCGARLVATVGTKTMMREVLCGSAGVASGSDTVVHFGLGKSSAVSALEIDWPSGTKQVLTNVAVDRLMTVVEP